MKNLIQVELTRLRWRRAAIVMFLVAIVAPLLIASAVLWETRPISDADIADAKQEAEQSAAMWRDNYERCVSHPEDFDQAPGDDLAQRCQEWTGYSPDQTMDWRDWIYRPALDLKAQIDESGSAIAAILVIAAVLIGTTFVGADWASGSMSNQLLFEPRRRRIWWAKAIAVAVGGAVLSLVGMALYWALLGAGAAWRDLSTPAGLWRDVAGLAGRTAILAAAGAVAGYALTMLFRSTVATLGVVVVITGLSSLIIGLMPIDDPIQWQPTMHALAFLQDGFTYDFYPTDCYDAGCNGSERTISMLRGTLFLGALVLAAVGASLTAFRRRDVP
ncbi:ABC transporter permease subunit [Nocardioides sp. Bht2]|uniref:ABC transporter permease subunit n=1 Tax=Nocardioides sp. Bht2 TaxID=3392297 RepID=UPI0039B5228A